MKWQWPRSILPGHSWISCCSSYATWEITVEFWLTTPTFTSHTHPENPQCSTNVCAQIEMHRFSPPKRLTEVIANQTRKSFSWGESLPLWIHKCYQAEASISFKQVSIDFSLGRKSPAPTAFLSAKLLTSSLHGGFSQETFLSWN